MAKLYCEAQTTREGISTCEGELHRYDVGISSAGNLVVSIWVGNESEPRARIIAATPATLRAILTHAFTAGQDYAACERDCTDVTGDPDQEVWDYLDGEVKPTE